MEAAHRPHGRDEVVPAIRHATIELLADHSPRELTVRDIAARAGVNHALVHRHFGSKDDLVRSVLAAQSQLIADQAKALPRSPEAMLDLLGAHPGFFRALARTVLDAPDTFGDAPLPAGAAFLRLVGTPDDETRGAAAAAGALALGWLVFGDHLARALDAGDAESLRAPVAGAISSITRRRRRAAP